MEEQKLDYPRIYERLDGIFPDVMYETMAWSNLHPRWGMDCELMNYPPRIHLTIKLGARGGKRAENYLRERFNIYMLGTSLVNLLPVLALVNTLRKKFKLVTWGERTDQTLHFYFRLKVPSYILEDEKCTNTNG